MDSVFLLKDEARSCFLRSAAREIGCVYICLWFYLPHPSNCLVSMDGWYSEDDTNPASSSSGTPNQRLFDLYRRSFCSVETGCVPGLAHKEGLDYLEVGESELMGTAVIPAQRQFYQEAGIKTAVFMGCKSGEIELGMSTPIDTNKQMDIKNMFTNDINVQQSPLEEIFQPDQSRPSSSSSSLRSLSVSSPEYSSLILTKANTSSMAEVMKETSKEQEAPTQLITPLVPLHHHMTTMQAYSRFHDMQFPTSAGDDAVMTRAMLAVISSPSSSSSSVYPPPWSRSHQNQASSRRAFRPYNSALNPKSIWKPNLRSQKMMKTAFSMLKQISLMNAEARMRETRPTSNQVHHMISERKRREKLNESFLALRMMLPPGTKKDKASVLASTKDYLNSLKAQISDLDQKNKSLEMRLLPKFETGAEDGHSSSERVNVQIFKAPESASEVQQMELRVTVRVECDMIELVLHILECLKEMGGIGLVSIEADTYAHQMNSIRRATLALEIKGGEWDEGSFKEAVSKAVDEVVATQSELPSRPELNLAHLP